MNRIDRVSAILIQLQSKRLVRAKEIADRFTISLRTVYRDIKALEEAGIPVIGEAGAGYSLMEGYRLPPVMFTTEEAIAFITAGKLVDKLTDSSTRDSYQAAMYKVKAVLRLAEKDYLEEMDDSIAVIESPQFKTEKADTRHLQTILKAIASRVVVNISYFAEHSQQSTNRDIEPVGIFYLGRFWYLIAFCRLRNDYRHFKVERVTAMYSSEQHFKSAHPTLQSFLDKMSCERELHSIVILVEKDILRYFGDQKYYNGFVSQKEKGGKMEMRFFTESLNGFAKWYLLFGEHAEIIEPPHLKNIVLQYIKAIEKKLEK